MTFFPEVIPSTEQCFEDVTAAILDADARIFLDASTLITCYELSAGARDELLDALEGWGDRVTVPTWAASEVWEYISNRISTKPPLQGPAAKVKNELSNFKKAAQRYVDDDTIPDLSQAEFHSSLGTAISDILELITKVEKLQPKTDVTTARLLPFMESRRLSSDLPPIFEALNNTATIRLSHRVPPGFGDHMPEGQSEDGDSGGRSKGKKQNAYGDIIIWHEILADCENRDASQLILVTKDTTKGDWAYLPKKVKDEKGRPQPNGGQITLPHPLLVHEAMSKCRSLRGVHVVSVEMLANVLHKKMKLPVVKLSAALQEPDIGVGADLVNNQPEASEDADPYFDSSDLAYDYPLGNDVDEAIQALHVEGWQAQNAAARDLESLLPRANRDQRIQIGRGLAAAANDNAILPIEFLQRVLGSSVPARRDILVGVLAEIYLAENGEPKLPQSPQGLTEVVYQFESDQNLSAAYHAVLDRLIAQRRMYVGLPTDHAATVKVDFQLEDNGRLKGATVDGYQLLRELVPANRTLARGGGDTEMSVGELTAAIAAHFVLPQRAIGADLASNFQLKIPKHVGFVEWGPQTGAQLR